MGVAAASAHLPKVIPEVSLDGVLRAFVVQPSQEHLAIGHILARRAHVCPQPADAMTGVVARGGSWFSRSTPT